MMEALEKPNHYESLKEMWQSIRKAYHSTRYSLKDLGHFYSFLYLLMSSKKRQTYTIHRKNKKRAMLSPVRRDSRISPNSERLRGLRSIILRRPALKEQVELKMRTQKLKIEQKFGMGSHRCLLLFFIVWGTPEYSKACSGRFVNPINDICWNCLFPLSIGPTRVSGGNREDTPNPRHIPCLCPRPPLLIPVPGIPVGFWEPARLVDVTRVPFCMVSLGGMKLGSSTVGYGVHGYGGESRAQNSFYQVHWYVYPVLYWLELIVDFLCLEQQSFDVAYITELDPLWNADELAFILNPEAILFGNPIAQAACAADCTAATSKFPLNSLFWCGGCQGSLYPFTGNTAAHNGGVQASLLMVQRMIAKLHRELLLWGTSGTTNGEICQKYPMPLIKKTQYKTQMTYPRPTTRGPLACNPLGRSEVIWGAGREFPYKGEDFGYLIWRKRNCCICAM